MNLILGLRNKKRNKYYVFQLKNAILELDCSWLRTLVAFPEALNSVLNTYTRHDPLTPDKVQESRSDASGLCRLSFMCSYPRVHTCAYTELKIKNDFKGCHATYSFVKENKYNVNEILDSAVNCWKYKEHHFKKTKFI